MKKIFKERFYQPGYEGIPPHWVVQYYIDDNAFIEAAYFKEEKDAIKFEDELLKKDAWTKGYS